MYTFIINIYDKETETEMTTVCKSIGEVSLFLEHLNTSRYELLGDIEVVHGEFVADYKNICNSPIDGFEFGKGD